MLRTTSVLSLFFLLLFLTVPEHPAAGQNFDVLREKLIRQISGDVHATSMYLDKTALDEKVMTTMAHVPRHLFVPKKYIRYAYENRPLPIGEGQTISQPYIVAVMTDLLNIQPSDRILEIGTGSGYQAAVLSELADKVFTIEIIRTLHQSAVKRLADLGYTNVTARLGDGYFGWEENAPFNAIMVTASSAQIPPPLISQLKPGGRMVIPVGSAFLTQYLVLVEKKKDSTVTTRQILPVRFVPLTGSH